MTLAKTTRTQNLDLTFVIAPIFSLTCYAFTLMLFSSEREFLSIGMRLRSIIARTLLTLVVLEIALGDLIWPVSADFWRVFSIPFIGWALSDFIVRDQEFRSQTDPPLLLAVAVAIGFMVRGAVDLLQSLIT